MPSQWGPKSRRNLLDLVEENPESPECTIIEDEGEEENKGMPWADIVGAVLALADAPRSLDDLHQVDTKMMTKPQKYPCKDCDKSYKRLRALKDHKKTHCPKRGKTKKSKENTPKTEVIDNKCTECNLTFTNPRSLRAHVSRLHDESKNRNVTPELAANCRMPCESCDKLMYVGQYPRHSRVTVECRHCETIQSLRVGMSPPPIVAMMRAKRARKLRQHVCFRCYASLSSYAALVQHEEMLHPEHPITEEGRQWILPSLNSMYGDYKTEKAVRRRRGVRMTEEMMVGGRTKRGVAMKGEEGGVPCGQCNVVCTSTVARYHHERYYH